MQIGRIEGATRTLGQSQGYIGLPVRDVVINTVVDGPNTPAMETAWFPTYEEMQKIIDGAPIILQVIGRAHPPVMLSVGDVPTLTGG